MPNGVEGMRVQFNDVAMLKTCSGLRNREGCQAIPKENQNLKHQLQ